MRVAANKILPSQNFLQPATIAFIFHCLRIGDESALPLDPIVRRGSGGELVAIDGHNLIAVRQFRGEPVEVHLAASEVDGLPATSEANNKRNQDLKVKLETALGLRRQVAAGGIETFADLVARYRNLFETEARR